jgi:hypothetical protein
MRLPKRQLSKRARSKRSEKEAAQTLEGRVQPASGAIPVFNLKGDVKTKRFLIDDKTTHAGSFAVSLKLFRKLSNEAWKNKKRPAIRISFDNSAPLYVIEESEFMKLQEIV